MYSPVGLEFKPDGLLVAEYSNETIKHVSWTADLLDTMKPLLSSRPISSVRVDGLYSLTPKGIFAEDNDLWRHNQWLLVAWFAGAGNFDRNEVPRVLRRRQDPRLNMDDLVGRVIANRTFLLTPSELRLDAAARMSMFPDFYFHVIKTAATPYREAYKVRSQLDKHLMDVAYRAIHTPTSVSEHERSLLINYGDKGYNPQSYGLTEEQRTKGGFTAIRPTEHDSDLVQKTFGEACAVSTPGPYSRFWAIDANKNRNECVWTINPAAADLLFQYGYRLINGPFFKYELEESETGSWSPGDVLEYAMTRGLTFNDKRSPLEMVTPQRIGTQASVDTPLVPDETDLSLRLVVEKNGTETLRLKEFVWTDHTTAMAHSTVSGLSIEDYYSMRAANEGSFGGGMVADRHIPANLVIDENESSLGDGSIKDKPEQLYRDTTFELDIVHPDSTNTKLISTSIDFADLRRGFCPLEFLPCFREYVRLPLSTLDTEQPEMEAHVALRLGLSSQARRQARRVIRESINFALGARRYGEDAMPVTLTELRASNGAMCLRKGA